MAQLSAAEIQHDQQQGWVRPSWPLPGERAAAMREALDD